MEAMVQSYDQFITYQRRNEGCGVKGEAMMITMIIIIMIIMIMIII